MNFLRLIAIGLITTSASASELRSLQFTDDATALFAKGKVADQPITVTQDYHWIGGRFSIAFPYQVSQLNENMRCYHLQMNGVSTFDQARIEWQNLQVPANYFCETQIDVEVR